MRGVLLHMMSQFYTTAPAGAAPAPREGLPPCIKRFALFENRLAVLEDDAICGHSRSRGRFLVSAGQADLSRSEPGSSRHPEWKRWRITHSVMDLETDDPAEAAAAWQRAERWVRTGVLDEG